ncbi:MAG: hypothetical protein EA393_02400 [Bacteroidetes bacterium]|nr:MAG: hypothetical protein EA393_02400 [Bacteroidota bacterium]
MWFKNLILIILTLLIANDFAFAQETTTPKDSTEQKEARIYQNIETYSERSKFTRFMIRLFFKPVVPDLLPREVKPRPLQKPFSSFEGKIIRNINIVTLDPFGNSIGDTITTSLNFLSGTGNKLHVKTQTSTIRNLLLFRENHTFDSLLVKESERLVRSSKYITDVSFHVSEIPENQDSVDIYIRELDKWSIIPGGSLSSRRMAFSLREENFLGLGHEFHNGIVWNHTTGDYAFRTKYYVPNFRNTFINSTLQYGTDEYGNFIKSFAVDRPFFSPFAKWAAGVNISQHLRKDSVWAGNFMQFKYNAQDFWAGNAIRIFKGDTEFSRTTNFVSAARFTRIRYLEKPPPTVDTLQFYTNENTYLASLGISTRQYVQDKYIFKFGITEDVPVGRAISITGGYQEKHNFSRVYIGGRYSSGNYHSWGYLGSNIELGTYLRSSRSEQGVFSAELNYFTNLIEIGNWKLRQFVKPQFIHGIRRTDYNQVTLNEDYGLRGFYSPELSGNSRLLFTSQTQSYAPWNFIGFHFGPWASFSLGMLGDAETGFRGSRLYSQFGVGVLIKNDHLVMNAFQISISFYPIIPGRGENIFRINPFETADFGYRDFEIEKPATVVYQ